MLPLEPSLDQVDPRSVARKGWQPGLLNRGFDNSDQIRQHALVFAIHPRLAAL